MAVPKKTKLIQFQFNRVVIRPSITKLIK